MGNEYLESIIFSILPISELRGGIPYAIANNIDPLLALFLCVIANILVFPLVILFLEFLHPLFNKLDWYKNLFDKFVLKTRRKLGKKIEKYGFWALMIFVMVPLPITGAYTGSLASWIFNIPKKKAFLSILMGLIISGTIVTIIVISGTEVFNLFIKEI